MEKNQSVYSKLFDKVIRTGLCTHCGTCVGLSNGGLEFKDTYNGPLPMLINNNVLLNNPDIYDACPGKGLNYPILNKSVFGKVPDNWLIGNYQDIFIGYSKNNDIRSNAASAGIITHVLVYLLEQKLVDGVVVVQLGKYKPWEANPIIAITSEDIMKCSQSVYTPVPVNEILKEIEQFDGKLAYVGLPDQVSSIRYLQQVGNSTAKKIKYILGPYVGTIMYIKSIESYMRSNGFKRIDEMSDLKYRTGEWPGYMQITTKSGKVLKAEKFYYNYLIPFYITKSSLLSVDFTNELTDISVGDAWHPKYEEQRQGFSVIIARSNSGRQLLKDMQRENLISLEKTTAKNVMEMHGHMIDFKKRGAFVRFRFRQLLGKNVPDFGYLPQHISFIRILIEVMVSGIFLIGKTYIAKKLVELIPIKILGPMFNAFRKTWKNMSKPVKRKGLYNQVFIETTLNNN